jgi:hypothetical protein
MLGSYSIILKASFEKKYRYPMVYLITKWFTKQDPVIFFNHGGWLNP